MGEKITAADWWKVCDLPNGTILVDDEGTAYQVTRPRNPATPGETWVCPMSDEYATIVQPDGVAWIAADVAGGFTEVWRPSQ